MDLKIELENLKKELAVLGFDEVKINELLELASQEAVDRAIEETEEKLDDVQIEQLANKMQKEPQTKEEATIILNNIFEAIYGQDAENKKLEFVNDYLKETIEMTKQSKDLLTRYQQGDPTAVATIEANKDNPDVLELQKELENSTQTTSNTTSMDDAASPFPQQTSH